MSSLQIDLANAYNSQKLWQKKKNSNNYNHTTKSLIEGERERMAKAIPYWEQVSSHMDLKEWGVNSGKVPKLLAAH